MANSDNKQGNSLA